MRVIGPVPDVAVLFDEFKRIGGVLDFIFLDEPGNGPSDELHRTAALAGIAEIDGRLERWAQTHTSDEYPLSMFFRLKWDECKFKGGPVDLATFWGTDDVEPKQISDRAWSVPDRDGYKSAFFHPPYGLRGTRDEKVRLFERITRAVLGERPDLAEIYSWSTDWSNYFDAGHEWWGAFYWTIRPPGSGRFTVVAASSTD
jgi:hypothetical protein